MPKAKKLPSGSYRTQVYDYKDDTGKRIYKSFTAFSKKEAEYMAAEYILHKKNRVRTDFLILGDAFDHYISNRESVLSPRTITDYKRIRKTELKGIMKINIYDLTQEMIQKEINMDSKKHSPKTVRNTHGLLAAVIKCYRPDFALNTALPKKVRANIYIPSDEDVQCLVRCAEGTDMELPILLAAFGPMRRGEICALSTDDITGNIVHVRQNKVIDGAGNWIIKQPKSYAGDRYIEFPDFVAEKWKDISGQVTALTPNEITDRFPSILKNAGIKHFRFHDLRHYSVSAQHAIGIPDAYIMMRGGWENDGVLKGVYRHTMANQEIKMTRTANNHFTNLCNTKCNTKNKNPQKLEVSAAGDRT